MQDLNNNRLFITYGAVFRMFPQAIIGSEEIRKHSHNGNDWPLFKNCHLLVQF